MPQVGRAREKDLKATLLQHGIALAREGGPDAVSLRDVQRRAGVSNSAAYRHYTDRDELLLAISDHASAEMARRMEEQMAAVGVLDDSPAGRRRRARARFRATGSAYLDFALSEPGLFAVAMHPGALARKERPGPDATGTSGLGPYQLLVAAVDDLEAVGVLSPAARGFTDVAAWASVHGLAVLLLDGPLKTLTPDERHAAIDRLLDLVDAGLG
jgi:AcrR family transcriptional regulator